MGMKEKIKKKEKKNDHLCLDRYQEPNTNGRIKALGLKNNFICINQKIIFQPQKQIVLQWLKNDKKNKQKKSYFMLFYCI